MDNNKNIDCTYNNVMLKKYYIENNNISECAVCYEIYIKINSLSYNCTHSFCVECRSRCKICPLCRSKKVCLT